MTRAEYWDSGHMTRFCNIGFLSGQEEDLQDGEDELDGFISREDFKQPVAGQNDEPADSRATLALALAELH